MSTPALSMTNVVKRYGRRTALDGLSLTVPTGVAMGLVGSNGAGKTTAMSVAVGILRCQAGTINLLGDGPFDPRKHSGRVSLMPQDAELPLHARVRDLLSFYARLQGMASAAIPHAIEEVLDWVHLSDRTSSKIGSLSHGMRRRLVIAQAFLGAPALALLDEPLAGLDPREVASMRELLKQRPRGQTLVISSHNLHEIERICDHVSFIEHGQVTRQDRTDALTGHAHTMQYRLSTPKAPLDALAAALPAAHFALSDDGLSLSCRYADAELAVDEVNAQVLRVLLDHAVGLLEVRRGAELESAYLSQATPIEPRDGRAT
jgi:ABC-2 type transport system ATP-binding protein